ncbi:hypothetical protein [Vibrio alginolyticus]|uniref:hypothetical protein n=1 Tax=Vibrio alginolyticus TaxID=663 RepID=UPI002119FBE1|nr:hypothetical protein [Vibrio alginolyticus]MCQ9090969.1 hypothetical protein [Vibrio alginolyticus]
MNAFQHLFHECVTEPAKQRARPYDEIDPKIQTLVTAINSLDETETVASCQGHIWGYPKPPYVYFSSTVKQAQKLSKLFATLHENKTLHYYWLLSGHFNLEHQLMFKLRAPTLDDSAFELSRFIHMGTHRARLDTELNTLANHITREFKDD